MVQRRRKISSKHTKQYGFKFLLFLCGLLLPPIAVLVRFGIGGDFFLNILLTIMGYIPGHLHNFYLQNIRNNANRNRSPKWAVKYGLVHDYQADLRKKRTWANTYDERNPNNTYEDDLGTPQDEFGNPVVDDPAYAHNTNADRRQEQADFFEPTSARDLDRRSTNLSSDSEEFYRPEDSHTGRLPGEDERSYRSHGPQLPSFGRKKASSASKRDRFAELNAARQSYSSHASTRRPPSAHSEDAPEIDTNSLAHEF